MICTVLLLLHMGVLDNALPGVMYKCENKRGETRGEESQGRGEGGEKREVRGEGGGGEGGEGGGEEMG